MALWATTELLLHSTQAVVTVPKANITHTDSRHTAGRGEETPEAKGTQDGGADELISQLMLLCVFACVQIWQLCEFDIFNTSTF